MRSSHCGPSELSCHGHSTWQKPDRHSTHSGSKISKTTCSKNTKAQVHQIHWWLDERIPWQIHQNWQPPRWIQDMTTSQTQRRSMLCMLSQNPQMSLNSKSSSSWWHTSAPLSVACPLWLLLCENSWEKMPTSSGMPAMRLLFSKSSKPYQQHHPQVLWPITACDHTSQCLTGRPWCSTSTR